MDQSHCLFHHHYHLSLNRQGRWGTTNDFTTSFLHFSLFSAAHCDLANSRPVHSLMLSSHLFLCLPCRLPPFTVPCKMVLARPDEQETHPYRCSLHLFMMVRSSCGPIACWILARTCWLVTWSLYCLFKPLKTLCSFKPVDWCLPLLKEVNRDISRTLPDKTPLDTDLRVTESVTVG